MIIICKCSKQFKVLSQIPKNGQVNLKCDCGRYGFILNNILYVENDEGEYQCKTDLHEDQG